MTPKKGVNWVKLNFKLYRKVSFKYKFILMKYKRKKSNQIQKVK